MKYLSNWKCSIKNVAPLNIRVHASKTSSINYFDTHTQQPVLADRVELQILEALALKILLCDNSCDDAVGGDVGAISVEVWWGVWKC